MVDQLGPLEQVLASLAFGGEGWKVQDANSVAGVVTHTTHAANTWLDITGSGILAMVMGYAGSSTTVDIRIQIDGGPIIWLKETSRLLYVPLMFRFNTSLKVTSAGGRTYRAYPIALIGSDDRWSNLTAVGPVTTAHYANTVVDISGSPGVLTGLSVPGDYNFAVEVDDSGTIFWMGSSGNTPGGHCIPFQRRLRVTCGATTGNALYFLD